jgi:hypothetical protein
MNLIISFVLGMVVMDIVWAHKTGLLMTMLRRVRNLFRKGA